MNTHCVSESLSGCIWVLRSSSRSTSRAFALAAIVVIAALLPSAASSTVTISGYVRTQALAPLADVYVSCYSTVTSEYITSGYTASNGYYSLSVPYGSSCIVRAEKSLYQMLPASRTYVNLTSDSPLQNFQAGPYNTIKGRVHFADNAPLQWASIVANDGGYLATTDQNGNYTASVPPGWSGFLYAEMWQHTFEPPKRDYVNVTTSLTGQDYLAIPFKMISGYVRTGAGQPVAGVRVSTGDGISFADTGTDGLYCVYVPTGWNGTVSAQSGLYIFNPTSRSYSNVVSDIGEQNYVATALIQISGFVRDTSSQAIYPARLRTDDGREVLSDPSPAGHYMIAVPPGWSGTVTAQAWGYEMEPASRNYTSVTADTPNQDYAGHPVEKSLSDIKKCEDHTLVACENVLVSAVFSDFYYVESTSREFGIRIEKANPGADIPSQGTLISTWGFVSTGQNGERRITTSGYDQYGMDTTKPLFMSNRTIGGSNWFYIPATGAGQKGVAGASGLNNIGLLVKSCGVITERGGDWFKIDDGSGFGLKCVMSQGVTLDESQQRAVVTGVSSCEKDSEGKLHRVVLIRSQDDILDMN